MIQLFQQNEMRLIAKIQTRLRCLGKYDVVPAQYWELGDTVFLQHVHDWLADIGSGEYVELPSRGAKS